MRRYLRVSLLTLLACLANCGKPCPEYAVSNETLCLAAFAACSRQATPDAQCNGVIVSCAVFLTRDKCSE